MFKLQRKESLKFSADLLLETGFCKFDFRPNTFTKHGHFLQIIEEREESSDVRIWFLCGHEKQDVFWGTVTTEMEFCLLLKMLDLLG
jgi:hypothetical protein